MRLFISFAALLVSIVLLQLSSGAIGPLDVLSGLASDFSRQQIGLLGSAHYVGFFIGCWWAPRLIGTIGHSRGFAVFAALGAVGAIAHPMWIDANFWLGLRILSGLCIAGCYTVIEAWFQSKLTNQLRGKVMGAYRVVDIGASAAAQMMIGLLDPATYFSYNILAILACASILPLTLTKSTQPETPKTPRLRPIAAALTSPLGVAGVMVAGLTSAAFRMVGPIYGSDIGLNAGQIGTFLAAVLIGGALAQFPAGALADRFDRRNILVLFSVLTIPICFAFVQFGGTGLTLTYVLAFLFGVFSFPIFSISAAHANDFAPAESRVELNASLMFFFGVGAIFSPAISSFLIEAYGPNALFGFISLAHFALILFGLGRMLARPSTTTRTAYRYMPRTSFTIGRLLRRSDLDEK